jgi:hypothetical protein
MTADQKEAVRLWAKSLENVAAVVVALVNDDKADAAIESLEEIASTAKDVAEALRIEKTGRVQS